ncbi:hypothetical protein F7725_010089 [Dissostichus mawsoni]|uniref:Uncharacterized protein n=1 Tax=Dissostichus mawsoni TaxID=36200 RepID=A0A7J5XMY4_DISMA|nr:hypothetical protein F7725_010089 [Dissostichus mawsoni]
MIFFFRGAQGGRKCVCPACAQKGLDREKQNTVRLTVTAVDGGIPAKSGTSQIIINARIYENLEIGKTVIVLNATDADEGLNADIEYSLRSKGQITF